jgi:hypothetical protein
MLVQGLAASALGGDDRLAATAIVCMPTGTIKRRPLLVSAGGRSQRTSLPMLPGAMPAEDTAA